MTHWSWEYSLIDGRRKSGERKKGKCHQVHWRQIKLSKLCPGDSGFMSYGFKPTAWSLSLLTLPTPGSGRQPCSPRKAMEVRPDAGKFVLWTRRIWVWLSALILMLAVWPWALSLTSLSLLFSHLQIGKKQSQLCRLLGGWHEGLYILSAWHIVVRITANIYQRL